MTGTAFLSTGRLPSRRISAGNRRNNVADQKKSRRNGDGRKPQGGGSARSGGSRHSETGRGRPGDRTRSTPDPSSRRGALHVEGGAQQLPKWLREEIARVTRKDRLNPTLNILNTAADAFADGRYRLACEKLRAAKELSPRATAIRELLGLSAYRSGLWEEALRELRTFRRLAGDTTHMAVEMDCLRALGRPAEVRKTWDELHRLGGSPPAVKEAKVVYAAFLLDQGDAQGAWKVAEPKRITPGAFEEDLRQWYVAARAAASLGDTVTARRLLTAIEDHDAAFAGLDELTAEIVAREAR